MLQELCPNVGQNEKSLKERIACDVSQRIDRTWMYGDEFMDRGL